MGEQGVLGRKPIGDERQSPAGEQARRDAAGELVGVDVAARAEALSEVASILGAAARQLLKEAADGSPASI
jgi:hypothetical protein